MNYRNIVVAGDVGTGTTTLAKALADKLNWSYLSTGDIYRDYVLKNNLELWNHLSIPDEVDRQIDQEFISKVKNEKNIVFDTHYGGYFARGLRDVFKILLKCDPTEAEKRILGRTHTHTETVEDIRKRREENKKKFNKLYDPKTPEEPEYFDLIIDTTNSTKEETLEKSLESLR